MKKGWGLTRQGSWAPAAVIALATVVSGCATPQPSERRGLLQDGAGWDRIAAADHSHRSNRFAGIESRYRSSTLNRAPAASARGAHLSPAAAEVAQGGLRWPLARVQVTSPYGQRGREFHEGVDLRAPWGTPVLAAQDGIVLYAGGRIRGYGRMIVIRHQHQISTIYAHNSRLLVRAGQYVHQGQRIAFSGRTGHVTGPHLHFEVRDGQAALNPLEVLPSLRVAHNEQSATDLKGSRAVDPAVSKPRAEQVASADQNGDSSRSTDE